MADRLALFDNSLAIGKSLQYLAGPLRLLVELVLKKKYPTTWIHYVEGDVTSLNECDTRALLGTIISNKDIFQSEFEYKRTELFGFMNSAHVLIRARNLWAHQGTISNYDALIILDLIVRVIQEIRAHISHNTTEMNHQPLVERIQMIQSLYNQLLISHAQSIYPTQNSDQAFTMRPTDVYATVSQANININKSIGEYMDMDMD